METTPPRRSTGREIVARATEAALGTVPLAGNMLAVTFVTALNWRLEQRRGKWFTELAEAIEELRERVDDLDFETLADDDRFVDAVVAKVSDSHRSRGVEGLL